MATPYYNVDVDESEDLVIGGPRELIWASLCNTHTAAAFVKFYNATATDDVTVGTTAPVLTVAVPAGGVANIRNVTFDAGIVIAATENAADGDNTAPAAAVIASLAYA